MATADERPKDETGPGNIGTGWKLTVFRPDNQPSGEAKSRGQLKYKRNQALVREILARRYKGIDHQFVALAREYFGMEPDEELTNEAMLILMQVGAAIDKGNLEAARFIMERAYGKPTEYHEIQNTGARVEINIQPVVVQNAPEIKTDEE